MFELRVENVHFASVLKNDFVVQLSQSLNCGFRLPEFDERFPNFGLLENEDFNNLSKRSKKLIKIVMSDNVAVAIIDTNEKHGALFCLFVYHFAL